jgi:hypothetical protein
MQRFNDYLRRLPLGLYGILSGLIVAVAMFAFQIAAEGKSLSASVGLAVSCGIGGGIGCAIGRDRAHEWRRRFANRFAKPS